MNRVWPAMLLAVISLPSGAVATPDTSSSAQLERRERIFSKILVRAAQFAEVRHISSRPSCESVEPPEALATPDPLFISSALGRKVKVSFIIGIDGRVHSPLILERDRKSVV